jgi:hypothetical protein
MSVYYSVHATKLSGITSRGPSLLIFEIICTRFKSSVVEPEPEP